MTMKREEAIRLIGWLKCTTNREDDLEAIDMAIEALSTEAVPIEEVWECVQPLKDKILDFEEKLIDAEVVVRCKDCRHRDLFSCPLADNNFQKDEDFCSWGERREE